MAEWKKILLTPNDTLELAIELLQKGGFRIALVADSQRKLVGTVTDGDIRRALIDKLTMTSQVKLIMNPNPISVSNKVENKDILALMTDQDILHMPIIDENGILCGLETLQHLIETPKHDNPIFLMAGGFGTRLHPLTKNVPKPLLKLSGKPILETIIEQFKLYGFHDFYISTHFESNQIQEYFNNGESQSISITYLHEDVPLGTAGSLGLLDKNKLLDLPLIVMNSDLLTKVDFNELLSFHNSQGGDATMCVREHSFQVPYGVVKTKSHQVISIEEKPTHKFFVNAGIYVLNPSILDDLDGKTYLDMPNLLEQKIKSGKINMFPLHEYWLDIGQMEHFEQAQKDSQKLF